MRLTNQQKSILYICRSIIKSKTGDDIDCELGNLTISEIFNCCTSAINFDQCFNAVNTLIKRKILTRNSDKTISFSDQSEYYNKVCDKLAERFFIEAGWSASTPPN